MKIREPIKPIEPQKIWIKEYTKNITISDCDFDEDDPESTVFYFSNILSLREEIGITIPNNKLQLVIKVDKTRDHAYVNNAYFHYEYEEENPNYEKEMEVYDKKL